MRLRAVLIQHAIVKRISWHPTYQNLLLVQTFQAEAILYLWDANTNEPRILFFPTLKLTSRPEAQWVPGQETKLPTIVFGDAHGCALAWPEGRNEVVVDELLVAQDIDARSEVSEAVSEEDSLYAILSGKKSEPADDADETRQTTAGDQSDLDTAADVPLEDTFHFRRGVGVH